MKKIQNTISGLLHICLILILISITFVGCGTSKSKTVSYNDLSPDQQRFVDSVYSEHEDWETTYDSGMTFSCKAVTFTEYNGELLFVAGIPLSASDEYETGQTETGVNVTTTGPSTIVAYQLNKEGEIVEPTVDPPTGILMAQTAVLRNYDINSEESDKLDALATAYYHYLHP